MIRQPPRASIIQSVSSAIKIAPIEQLGDPPFGSFLLSQNHRRSDGRLGSTPLQRPLHRFPNALRDLVGDPALIGLIQNSQRFQRLSRLQQELRFVSVERRIAGAGVDLLLTQLRSGDGLTAGGQSGGSNTQREVTGDSTLLCLIQHSQRRLRLACLQQRLRFVTVERRIARRRWTLQ
jgi:hypothetical protein